jgi:hypothetical protein
VTIESQCVTNVHEQLKDKLKRDQVKAVVESLTAMADRDPDLTSSYARKLKLAARRLTEEEVLAAKREKIQRARNIIVRKEIAGRLSVGASEGRKASSEIYNMTSGSVRSGTRTADSMDAGYHALAAKWSGGLEMELRKAGVLDALMSRGLPRHDFAAFEDALGREMSRLNGGPDAPTGNKMAATAAEILNKYSEAFRVAQNKQGAFIGKAKGYIGSQTHDTVKIAKAGKEAWKQKIIQRLDPETFANVKNVDEFLDAAWTNLATGNHMKDAGTPTGSFSYIGPGNLANRVSQRRVFIFKSGADWLAYNREFGVGSVLDGALHNLDRAARNVAVMQKWGTNPEAMFQSVIDAEIVKAKKAGDIQEVAELESGKKQQGGLTPSLLANFQAASGAANIPGNPRAADWMQGARNVISMSKLGGVVLSSFPDLAVRATALRHNGVGLLDGIANGLQSLAIGRGSGETRDATNLLIGMFDGSRDSMISRFSAADGVPGTGSKLAGKFFKLTGLTWWQDALMGGMGRMLSQNLAKRFGNSFDELPALLRGNLQRYGIDAADWDAIRATPAQMMDGADYVFAQNYEGDLGTKLQTYFVDQAREGMTMAGAAERAWVTQFGPPGSLAGEAARFTMQFKTYSITMARRHFGREIRREGSGALGIAFLMAATTLLGYGSMVAKDLAKMRTPRDPTDPSTWAAAMTQGGGAGIYGDFLLGQYNRFGSGLTETLAGPAFGTVADWARIFAQIKDAGLGVETDPGKLASGTIRQAVNTLPFANLFYTRAALDYLFLYQIQEALDPGSLKRMERRIERENNQQFMLKPSEYHVEF